MKQGELFEHLPLARKNPESKRKKGEQCNKCEFHCRPHNYRSDWIYCKIIPSKRTQFGISRTKARSWCILFKVKEVPHGIKFRES